MIAPPLLADEARRLATLHRLDILDTAPEERFDRITRLARRLFNVPVALVSLIDDDRQWFKSVAGMSVVQAPRAISFCGHAIASNALLLVRDAHLDPRFHDNPLVTAEPHVRFYAGCPLSTPNGSRIGTLCVIDSQTREFSDEDSALLSDLARMVEGELNALPMASLDELTGMPNRQAFKRLAQHQLDDCAERRLLASMICVDLDGLGTLNDRHGHHEGDRALQAFAAILRDTFHDADVIGRIGGDEFAILLRQCCEVDAASALRRLQARLDVHNGSGAFDHELRFSASQVTVDASRQHAVEALLVEADTRLYECKRSKAVRAVPPGATCRVTS